MMATELAKAYVQIVPSTRGISQSLSKEMSGAGTSAGAAAGGKLGSAIRGALAAAGIGEALKAVISEGAALEQALGGVETLFGDSADRVIANAERAYKTAGLSANAYMESVTGFSAALLQGLGGDTEAAAAAADMALIDMADNANKMGTAMESIQTAYQGFAKQNYTMLDNLKLGYGGTKSEMERLLKDAQAITGVKYDIENLSDVYEAIHVIQGELGITGTTAQESASTFSGSLASMAAAGKNVMADLMLGEDMTQSLSALTDTVLIFVQDNLMPALGRIFSALPQLIGQMVPQLLSLGRELILSVAAGITSATPELLPSATSAALDWIAQLAAMVPEILSLGAELLVALADGILAALPELVDRAPIIVGDLVDGITGSIPKLASAAVDIIMGLVDYLLQPGNIAKLITGAYDIIRSLATGLIRAQGALLQAAVELIARLWDSFRKTDWGSLGRSIITGLKQGIMGAASQIWNAIRSICQNVWKSVKDFFGIRSPSKEMAWIGQMLDEGLAEGITGHTRGVVRAVDAVAALTQGGFESTLQLNTQATALPQATAQDALLQAVLQLGDRISAMQVVLDTGATVGGIEATMDAAMGRRGVLAARGVTV